MQNGVKLSVIGIAVWFCATAQFLSAQASSSRARQAQMEKADRQKLADMEELIKSSVRSFHVIGKVVDQDGTPVSGAAVIIQIQGYSPRGELSGLDVLEKAWKTDPSGFFECKKIKGINLILKNIEKTGYEFQRPNDAGREFEAVNENPNFKPDINQPLVFRLRKKNEPAYVIVNEYSDRFSANPASYVMNLAAGGSDYQGRMDTAGVVPSYVKPVKPVDLAINSTFDPQTGFTLRLAPPDTNTWILEHNTVAVTAPETGYQTNAIVMPFSRQVNTNKFLRRCYYVRGRGGQLFARLEVEYRPNAAKTNLSFTIKTYANPNGSRNLEYDPKYNFKHDHPE